MTKDKANRLIHYLDDFGPNYFLVAQLTRISPETYRAIAPSIRDEALYHEGQAIALIRENAEKVAAVVAELRRTVTLKAAFEAPPEDPLAVLQKECGEMAPRIEELIAKIRHKREDVRASICALRERLNRIEMTI